MGSDDSRMTHLSRDTGAATRHPPRVSRGVIKRHVTRIEALAEHAARLNPIIDARPTDSHVKEIRFLAGDEERFVAHGIRQAETWLAGFMQAKAG